MLPIETEGPSTQQAKQGKRERETPERENREKQNNNKHNKQNIERETLNTSRSWLRIVVHRIHAYRKFRTRSANPGHCDFKTMVPDCRSTKSNTLDLNTDSLMQLAAPIGCVRPSAREELDTLRK